MHRQSRETAGLGHGTTILLRDKEGKPAKWEMDFLPKSYRYRCIITIDDESYRGTGVTEERAMKSACEKYLRKSGRID